VESESRDLVYVHSNMPLLDKISAADYTETTVEWEHW